MNSTTITNLQHVNCTSGRGTMVYPNISTFKESDEYGFQWECIRIDRYGDYETPACVLLNTYYRVRFGHMDKNGKIADSTFEGPFERMGEAAKVVDDSYYFAERDGNGLRYVLIERSNDGGKTWPDVLWKGYQTGLWDPEE